MWNFIGKLQKKPKGERKRIVFMTASGITLIIAGIWFVSFYFNVLTVRQTKKTAETSPIMILKANLSNVYQSFSQTAPTTTNSTTTLTNSSTTTSQ